MPDGLALILLLLNSFAAGWLFLYGLNAYWLTAHRHPKLKQIQPLTTWPKVTIQLPIFNELYVAQRLVTSVCALDYPREQLYIQVLDDSTDETQQILQAQILNLQQEGYQIRYIHRTERKGYKAGALQAAHSQVESEYVAIFDADFVPSSDWLKRTLAYFDSPDIGAVQTRWSHLNREYSLLTRLQSLGIDGHFTIEQQARDGQGYWLNFNGTAGIWRMAAIEAGGGWQADTLAEDMDLSYRVQLAGWRLVYAQNITAGAELPVTIAAYKLQQYRWAKGSIQCARKLLASVLAHRQTPMHKLQALLHLTGYSVHPFMVLILLLSLPLLLVPWASKHPLSMVWGTLMVPATLGPPLLYLTAQRDLNPNFWKQSIRSVLFLAVLGTGISLANSRAVFAAFWDTKIQFQRTPKFAIQNHRDRWQHKRYRLGLDLVTLGELLLCGYSALAIRAALDAGAFGILPFLLLYFFGYGYVGGLSVWQWWEQQKPTTYSQAEESLSFKDP